MKKKKVMEMRILLCCLYDINENIVLQLVGYNEQILDVVFVGEGETHLVVATNSIQLQVYDCSTFNCRLLFGHTALVLALTAHPALPKVFASRFD